jgi:DNA transformation protein
VAVTASFREFVIEQLDQAGRDIRDKRMFGGVGIYSGELFFALIDNDILYLKVDDLSRSRYEGAGMTAFRPHGDDSVTMQYYQVPIGILEDVDALRGWVTEAVAAAARATKKPRSRSAR